MEGEVEPVLWKSESQSESMVSVTVGRVMSTLLSARPKKLQEAIARLSSHSKTSSLDSLDGGLWFLHKYVRDAAERKESLDEVLVPMIENSLRCKELKRGGQAMILLNWLFQDELLFQVLATDLANVILRKEDHYIALGWCTLIRGLLEYETTMNNCLINGIKEKFNALLKILSSCLSHLSHIVYKGSTSQDGFELPSRLSVSAADCFLAITEAFTKKAEVTSTSAKLSSSNAAKRPIALVPAVSRDEKVKPAIKSSEIPSMEMEYLLWDHLQELINLVQRLLAWSRKSRPLHAKGLDQVLKWLDELREYNRFQDEAGSKFLKPGVLLLFSCWKHYSMLLHLEDHKFSQHYKEFLNQYLSGIQFYTENCNEGNTENKAGGISTIKFFLNCLCLLLGRLDSKKIESTVSEYGAQISEVLLPQLHSADEDLIDGAVCIFKAVIFKANCSPGSSLTGIRQMDALLSPLLHLIEESDGIARAVVILIAEYCSISTEDRCLQEVLKLLASGNILQRRNAIGIISEFIRISSVSANIISHKAWKDIANHLLECLGDEEDAISEQASNLLPLIDHSFVLPALIGLIYSSNGRVQSSATKALIVMLQYHNQKHEVIYLFLDCLSNLSEGLDFPKGDTKEVSKLNTDRVLSLIPEWSKSVQDWNCLIGPLIDKMFAEPSNAVIVKFLSYISEHLGEAADVVLHHVRMHVKGQKEINKSFFSAKGNKNYASDDYVEMQEAVFERLCPLLIIRLLPLRVFDDLNSSILYSQLLIQVSDNEDINMLDLQCIASFLLSRAFGKLEFEDVRKLAAELCGRLHPQVLFPIVCSELDHAADSYDILKIKACLFSVCTSLVVRVVEPSSHSILLRIRKTLEKILLWPSLDDDEVSKAQHGCIDCLALMICAELRAVESSKYSFAKDVTIVGKNRDPGNSTSTKSSLTYVIYHLVNDKNKDFPSKLGGENCAAEAHVPLSFRLCMANVLISVCQKISDSGKEAFIEKTLPRLIHSIQAEMHSEIKAACIQVLFSVVYHLKMAVLLYSSDLFELSIKFLKEGSEKERMASAKLMASLMGSEDKIMESISGGLLEARSLLSNLSLKDPSPDLQQICKKLLLCITSP